MESETLRKIGLALHAVADGLWELGDAVLEEVTVEQGSVFHQVPDPGCCGCGLTDPESDDDWEVDIEDADWAFDDDEEDDVEDLDDEDVEEVAEFEDDEDEW